MSSAVRAILANLDMGDSPVITVQCNGGNIAVNKILLTATSNVFKTMFTTNMLEKHTNTVSATDIDFSTMKNIINYYDKGIVADPLDIDEVAFSYIVEKYNFVGIKEAVADTLLDKFKKEQDIEILEKIFTSFNGHAQKIIAVSEIATMIASGKIKYTTTSQKTINPTFLTNLTGQDFVELSRSCCAILRCSDFSKWKSFLDVFQSWAQKNSKVESVVMMEIIGMIDVRKFSASEVLGILNFSILNKELEPFNRLFKEVLRYNNHMPVFHNLTVNN